MPREHGEAGWQRWVRVLAARIGLPGARSAEVARLQVEIARKAEDGVVLDWLLPRVASLLDVDLPRRGDGGSRDEQIVAVLSAIGALQARQWEAEAAQADGPSPAEQVVTVATLRRLRRGHARGERWRREIEWLLDVDNSEHPSDGELVRRLWEMRAQARASTHRRVADALRGAWVRLRL